MQHPPARGFDDRGVKQLSRVPSSKYRRASAIMRRLAPLVLAIFASAAAVLGPPASARQAGELGQRMLVLSIDQGYPNGAVATVDTAGLQRVLADVKAFSERFKTYALLASSVDSDALRKTLDRLVDNKIPFFLDAMGSAAATKISTHQLAMPYGPSTGQEMSIAQLAAYKQRYGKYFAGIRIMELFSLTYAIHESKFHGKTYANRFQQYWPANGDYFNASVVEPYIRWAAQNGMVVDFSDWLWSFDHKRLPSDIEQPRYEAELRAMLQRYPNVVVVTYANNEPGGRSRRADWIPAFRQWLDYRAKGFGLSDQDWVCKVPKQIGSEMNCPPEELIEWAQRAYRAGALMVQLEPAWYWWGFPRGTTENSSDSIPENERGRARPPLIAFAHAFDVRLPGE
jgi:hypothetical protein